MVNKNTKILTDDEKFNLVKKLREQTDFGMMDCKKALFETNYNIEEAKNWLVQFHKSHKLYK